MMAAVTVAIIKTPISTTVILSILSSTSMVPVILISCTVSFLLVNNSTQQKFLQCYAQNTGGIFVMRPTKSRLNYRRIFSNSCAEATSLM